MYTSYTCIKEFTIKANRYTAKFGVQGAVTAKYIGMSIISRDNLWLLCTPV